VHRVDPDIRRTQLHRRDFGHPANGELASRVGSQHRHPGDPLDRREVDDRATAAAFHHRHGGTHAEESADLIDPDHSLVVRQGHLVQCAEDENSGVVDKHIESAEQSVDLGHGVMPGLLVPDVEVLEPGGVAQLVGQRLSLLAEHIGNDHPGALGDETPSSRRPLTTCSPGDQRGLAVESSHHCVPSSGFRATRVTSFHRDRNLSTGAESRPADRWR
jgi:hypothetical protein